MQKTGNGILVLAEQKYGKIHKITYELLGKAAELAKQSGAPVYCALASPEGMPVQELFFRGADKVFYSAHERFNAPEELFFTRGFEKIIREAEPAVCLVGATSFGRSLAPRLAAALKTGLTADCTGLTMDGDGRLVQIRPAFSENILAHIKTDTLPQMATVRYREFAEAPRDESRTGELVMVDAPQVPQDLAQVVRELKAQEADIADADVVVAVGRGLKDARDLPMFQELADLLGGMLGASRSLVDDGVIGHNAQVGYSGSRVKPRLYIACGISGAPQHIAGMRESGYIVAINSDPSAPIFNVADLGLCADMYRAVPELIRRIRQEKGEAVRREKSVS